jgi:hypothetical protein
VVAKVQGRLHREISCRGHGQTQELYRQDPPGIEVLHLTQAAAGLLTICPLGDMEVSVQHNSWFISSTVHSADNSRPQSSRSTSGEVLEIPEVGIQPPSSPTLSLDEPISAGIRRRRDSGPSNHGDPTKLTPQHTKRLKMHAKKACEENEVPQDEVMTFIDVLTSYRTAAMLC